MENLGDTFIDGNLLSLENSDVNELYKYLRIVKKKKEEQKEKLNVFLEQIYS